MPKKKTTKKEQKPKIIEKFHKIQRDEKKWSVVTIVLEDGKEVKRTHTLKNALPYIKARFIRMIEQDCRDQRKNNVTVA